MAEQRIVVRIAPDGAIQAETRGIQGEACLDYLQALEELLDAQTVESQFTPEYTQAITTIESEVVSDLRQH